MMLTQDGVTQDHTLVDPVCGERLIESEAVASCDHNGRTHYFKHIKCKMQFERGPTDYLDQSGSPTVTPRAGPAESEARVVTSARPMRPWILAGAAALAACLAGGLLAVMGPQQPRPISAEPPSVAQPQSAPPGLEPSAQKIETAEVDEMASVSAAAREKYERGLGLARQGETGAAVAALEQVVAEEPRLIEAQALLGTLYLRQDRNKLAVEAMLAYLAAEPTGERAAKVEAMLAAALPGTAARSLPARQQPRRPRPTGESAAAEKKGGRPSAAPNAADPREAFERGNRLLEEGKPRRALEAYRHCLRSDPDFSEAYVALGLTYKQLGLNKSAARSLLGYLRHGTDPAQRERVRSLLSQVEP